VALLGASFQIGRSALAAYQSAIAITGQNIANVANPNYTRLTGRLSTLEGGLAGGIAAGGGVTLSALQRHIDEALETRLRMSLGSRAAAESTYRSLSQVEALYNELTEYDLSTQLTNFFNTFADLQNNPEELTSRHLVLSEADSVIRTLRRQRSALLNQAVDLNSAVEQSVSRANALAQEIADLNQLVVTQEARGSGYSAPLRDRRDALLRELGELMDIQVRERDNGAINVYIGGEPLVEFNRSRGLVVERELEQGLELASVHFGDNHGTVLIRDGRLAAQLTARDEHLLGQVQALDQLARGLIYEVNRVHSTGRGLVGYTSLTSNYAVADTNAALNSTQAGLPFPLQNGSFIVHARNQDTGQTTTRLIKIDLDGIGTDTTLAALAAQLDGVPNLSAGITSDNRLALTAAAGFEISFSEDSSGALAALGLATLLDGTNAANIDITAAVRSDVRLLAASLSGLSSDGDNAGRLMTVRQASSTLLGNQSVEDFQAAMVNRLAVQASAALNTYEASDAVYSSLMAQREAVSGVSLDEEAVNLSRFETAYNAAARYFTVLDSMANEVLRLVS
jgi:flagellar hook-associated protein 1 FlgK